ncbi:MAG: SCO family protein [Deltaproteobacteria bacterium]|nr:SCO family protein [Deltaproteobacteria bacterium]MCX7953375.1 SCO family protein [Deltaproteobacteria bacterium]
MKIIRLIKLLAAVVFCQTQDIPVESIRVENKIGNFAHNFSGYSSSGKPARLSELTKELPTLLIPVYYECPSICGEIIKETIRYVDNSKLVPGKDYNLVFFTINPQEDVELAAGKRNSFLNEVSNKSADVNFLIGPAEEIDKLTKSIGFYFTKQGDEYVHPPLYVIMDKDLKITHMFKTLLLDFPTVDLALVEASEGKLGTFWDKVKLLCYSFDPAKGRYTLVAVRTMQIGGLITLIFFIVLFAWLWKKEKIRQS